ncbi:MAG: hypothetical protein R3A10_22940 [Caldilineaceae bacterium]
MADSDGLTLAGFGAGVMVAGLLSYWVHTSRARRLRESTHSAGARRVDRTVAHQRPQRAAALHRPYAGATAHGWSEMLADATSCTRFSSPPERFFPGAARTPGPCAFCQPHAGETLVGDCTAFLQGQLTRRGGASKTGWTFSGATRRRAHAADSARRRR